MSEGHPTAELLALMQEQGDNLSVARDVDFFLLFEEQEAAQAFVSEAPGRGEFRQELIPYEKPGHWQVVLTVHMVPELEALLAREQQVAEFVRDRGGESDGWGCTARSP